MRLTWMALTLVLLAVPCRSVEDHKVIEHEQSIKCIRGKIADPTGQPISGASISVLDNPDVWFDPKLNFFQRLARQHELTTATSDEHGRFSLKKLKKGKYEVLFQRSGFDPFSVIVRVDSSVPCKKGCVNLCVSGACFEKPRFEQCE